MDSLVLDTTAVQLRIKEIIKDDIFAGIAEAQTKKKVRKIIFDFSQTVENPFTRADMFRGLSKSFAAWYRFFALSVLAVQRFEAVNVELAKAAASHIIPGEAFKGIAFNIPNRPYLTDAKKGLALVENYHSRQKEEYSRIVTELADSEATLSKGVSLRNLAEIEVRRQAVNSDLEKFKDDGVNLVWCSTHADCSKRCQPWQGGLYSLRGRAGKIDGIEYIPLETAVNVQVVSGGKTYTNGLLGYNCRHRLIPYQKGSTPPAEYSEREIRRERAIDQKQRQMERNIRKEKMRGHLLKGVDNAQSKEAYSKARELTKKYRQFSDENDRAAFLQRTAVTREEIVNNR